MIREIIKPTTEKYSLTIPREYINKEVEILVLPFFYDAKKQSKNSDGHIFAKTAGILKNKNIDPLKWQENIRADRIL